MQRFHRLDSTTLSVNGHDCGTCRRRGRFVRGTSRRLRAPLTVIEKGIRLLTRDRKVARRRVRRLSRVCTALKHTMGLGGSLLLLSHVRGKRCARVRSISISRVLSRLLPSLVSVCRRGRIELVQGQRRRPFVVHYGRSLTRVLISGLIGGSLLRGERKKRLRMLAAPASLIVGGANSIPLSKRGLFQHFCRNVSNGGSSAKLKLTVTHSVTLSSSLGLACR